MVRKPFNVMVLGDGGWGTALAMVLDEAGADVTLWGAFADYIELMNRERRNPKFLPGVEVPASIRLTHDMAGAAKADLVVSVVPSQYLRSVMQSFKDVYSPGTPIVTATKGIEVDTLETAIQIIAGTLGLAEDGLADVAVVSGPSHAEEVARRMPTTVVSASRNRELARGVQERFNTERFRVYTNDDPVGVELAGCIKNVLSIAGGMVDGLGFGDNTKAALLSRGIVEMGRLGEAMGGQRATFFGLAGIGDLIVSCTSRHGRNRAVGEKLGRGMTIDAIVAEMEMVAEGIKTTRAVKELMERFGVEMPICREVYNVLYEDKKPDRALRDLMTRRVKDEVEW
jgi:glycerol-3-phosphate dehydrogenase (NAD(P)+)